MICHRVPYPPDKGDRIRSSHVLKELARLGTVDLAFLSDEPIPESTWAHLRRVCRNVAASPMGGTSRWVRAAWFQLTGRSATEGLFWSNRLARTIDGWMARQSYDAVVLYSSGVIPYVCGRRIVGRVIADLVDVDSEKWREYASRARAPRSWLFAREARRVRELERSAGSFAAVTLVSDPEAELYRKIAPHANVLSVLNGVDLEYFRPQPQAEASTCVFVGYLDYHANVLGLTWFCREVWPEIRRRFPEARFQVIGRNPTPPVQELSGLPGVEVVGPVDDVRRYVAASKLVLVPLPVARGIQNKVLEAMSLGKAVVGTTAALNGIALIPGEHALRADTPIEWVEAVSLLWADAARRQEMGARARQYVEVNHDWSRCLRPLMESVSLASQGASRQRSTALESA
jgi:sugar transferase (PEP-CTERM/EpsH1 system associated)